MNHRSRIKCLIIVINPESDQEVIIKNTLKVDQAQIQARNERKN